MNKILLGGQKKIYPAPFKDRCEAPIKKKIFERCGVYWTRHVRQKMRHYQLSENRVKRVMRHPSRAEEGIAPHTIACMQPAGKTEIWMMYQDFKIKGKPGIRIITAWRYPGKSPVNKKIPIPKDILQDLEKIIKK